MAVGSDQPNLRLHVPRPVQAEEEVQVAVDAHDVAVHEVGLGEPEREDGCGRVAVVPVGHEDRAEREAVVRGVHVARDAVVFASLRPHAAAGERGVRHTLIGYQP